ncbi:MAG: hypothetical protein ABSB94_03695 [Syntrophorhabdales bacterium]|jgi:hypothetical protein
MKKCLGVLIALFFFLGGLASAYAAGYTYSPIIYPGATALTLAYGINDAGTISGCYGITGGLNQGFSLLSNGTHTAITYPGALGAAAQVHGINNAGAVVGDYMDSSEV